MDDGSAARISDAHTQQPSLKGRRALVTGGTTGIGRAIAVLLASEGAKVFVCGRQQNHLDDALERLNQVGEASGVSMDLSAPEAADQLYDLAEDYMGGLDIAVINAAIPAQTVEVSAIELEYQIAVDYTAYLRTTQEAVKRMKPGSDIILIGSTSGVAQKAGSSVYVGAKAGVHAFGKALRIEVAEKDIKVGVIQPGFTGADFQEPEYSPEKQAEMIGRDLMLRAEDIAVAAHFMLAQPRRSAVSLIRVEPRLEDE